MNINELNRVYFRHVVRTKSKGAGRGVKRIVTCEFDESRSRADYLRELAEIDRAACGRFMCEIERADLMCDRYWDVPEYRAEYLNGYRSRINRIRKEYGLSRAEVAEFMRAC